MTIAEQQDQAIRSVIDGVYAAWNAQDVDAFVANYAESATATLPELRLEGKPAVRATMTAEFLGGLKGSHVCHEVRDVRAVAPETAVVTGRSAFVLAGEAEPTPDHIALTTWVLARHDGAWQIEAYHECRAGAL